MDFTNIEIQNIYLELLKSEKEIEEILNYPSKFPSEIIENLSIKIAFNYWKKNIEYFTANELISILFGYYTTNENFFNNYTFPNFSWDIYNAFDAGEFHHKEDDKNVNPVEKYTNTEIQNILKKAQIIK